MEEAQGRVHGVGRLRRWAVGFFFVAAFCSSCKKESEEDRVKAVVRAAVEAGNAKKAGDVVRDAAPGFKGPRDLDVDGCRRVLVGYFMSEGWIRGFEQDLDIQFVNETHARAELDLVLARGNEVKKLEDVVPTNAGRYVFTFELQKIDGDWKFTKADYKQRSM